jgi:PAS domain S-box-containing protein
MQAVNKTYRLEELYKLAAERTQEGLAITDPEGHYLYVNKAHLEMFGFENTAQLLGQSWKCLYSPEEATTIEHKAFPELKRHGAWRGRLKAIRRDGSAFMQDLMLSLSPTGEIICNCRDATEEMQMAEQLEANETLFRTFLNELSVAVYIRNVQGDYEFVNTAMIDFLKLENPHAMNAGDILKCLTQHPTFLYWGAADKRVATTGNSMRFDFPIFWAGKDWVLDVKKLPLKINTPAVSHVCTLVEDVTERRRLEAQEEANSKLSANYHIMQREFISMVSHEFRTPLTAIRGVHYLLSSRLQQLPPGELSDWHRFLSMQESAMDSLGELVDQVLLLNRIEHMSLELTPNTVPLAEFITRTVESIGGLLVKDRLSLKLEIPEHYVAMLDEPQMRAVLENLVSNALKYTLDSTKVIITVKTTPEDWELVVADKGRGIPPEDQPNLFRPFYRASNVGKSPGTGLGLTIIKRVVDFHNGAVTVESQLGKGTKFTLRFPRLFCRKGAINAVPTVDTAIPFLKPKN